MIVDCLSRWTSKSLTLSLITFPSSLGNSKSRTCSEKLRDFERHRSWRWKLWRQLGKARDEDWGARDDLYRTQHRHSYTQVHIARQGTTSARQSLRASGTGNMTLVMNYFRPLKFIVGHLHVFSNNWVRMTYINPLHLLRAQNFATHMLSCIIALDRVLTRIRSLFSLLDLHQSFLSTFLLGNCNKGKSW